MKNKYLIAGNWKMNLNLDQSISLVKNIINVEISKNVDVLICPTFVNISKVVEIIDDNRLLVGAQDCHFVESGAYTGEISPSMLTNIGTSHVILGHSERRQYFSEDNQLINKKINAALKEGLKVIYCIGETLEERNSDLTFKVIKSQLIEGLKNIEKDYLGNLIVAYEPVWAIGTGLTASAVQIRVAHNKIRDLMMEIAGSVGSKTLILYGGSMNENNAREILSIENVGGGLIGGASLKSEKFKEIIKIANELSLN